MRGSPYSVIVCDLFSLHDPDHETVVVGFPTRELAIEYARRRTWSSVEEVRHPGLAREQVRDRWLALGEDCRVVGPEGVVYVARTEIDLFLDQPCPPDKRDWAGFYRSMLPNDFAFTYEWIAGSVPPPHHYEYTIMVHDDGTGRILFWPDYPTNTIPAWEVHFHPSLSARILLYNWLHAAGMFTRAQNTPRHSAIGGETGTLSVRADEKEAHVAVYLLPDDERTIVHRVICAVVPDMVWEDLHARRKTYIESVYPETGA